MFSTRRLIIFPLLLCVVAPLLAPCSATAQSPNRPEVWRALAEKLEVGAEVQVRLANGQRFRATLIDATPDVLLVQPKTRIPLAVQPLPYEAIVLLERRGTGGMGAGKAALIGVASGVGAFFGMLLIVVATLED